MICILYTLKHEKSTHSLGVMGTPSLPGQVGELGVDRAGDYLCIDGKKLMHPIAECDDLSRADKRAAKDRTNKLTWECSPWGSDPSKTNQVIT